MFGCPHIPQITWALTVIPTCSWSKTASKNKQHMTVFKYDSGELAFVEKKDFQIQEISFIGHQATALLKVSTRVPDQTFG